MSDIINTEPGYYALAQPGGNITALEINQEINLFGSHVNLVGTTFDTYPPIQDALVEKKIEKEEGSWLGNLLTGIVVTAAFAGLAIATVATGGAALAAVALAGAAVGTGVVTAAVSYSDAKSGHARTWTQFLGNLAMGGAIGATTAASIYGLWTVLPAASQAAGLQVSLWTGTTSSMTVSTIPTIATYGGYGLMGANGAFALNEIASIGTGQNWMLDHVFGGNQEAYDGAALITGMCTMGYMEVGANNAALGGNRNTSSITSTNTDSKGPEKKNEDTVKYYRVQGGGDGNKTSQTRIIVNDDGSISIPDKDTTLYVSTGDRQHAEYFRDTKRPGGEIVEFEVPKYLDDLIKESAIPQQNYKMNPLNQGGAAPQIVDPTTPGSSLGLPPPFVEWLEEYGKNGILIK